MDWLWALLLGIVQGLTEFIPVSSSAHLIVLPWLFGVSDESVTNLPFDVALHLGTLVAVLVFFAGDWMRLLNGFVRSVMARRIPAGDSDARLAWMLAGASVPGGIAGLLFESRIEELFHAPGRPVTSSAIIALAAILALMGVALFVAERVATHVRRLEAISWRDALVDRRGAGSRDLPRRLSLRRNHHRRTGARSGAAGRCAVLVPSVGSHYRRSRPEEWDRRCPGLT